MIYRLLFLLLLLMLHYFTYLTIVYNQQVYMLWILIYY